MLPTSVRALPTSSRQAMLCRNCGILVTNVDVVGEATSSRVSCANSSTLTTPGMAATWGLTGPLPGLTGPLPGLTGAAAGPHGAAVRSHHITDLAYTTPTRHTR